MLPGKILELARNVDFHGFSASPDVIAKLEALHALVLAVCPDCCVRKRNGKKPPLIYVPLELCGHKRNKNLLTVWPFGAGMRIYPDKWEKYDPTNLAKYRVLLRNRHSELREKNGF